MHISPYTMNSSPHETKFVASEIIMYGCKVLDVCHKQYRYLVKLVQFVNCWLPRLPRLDTMPP